MPNIAGLDFEAQSASTSYGKIISVTGILYNDQFQELDRFELFCRNVPGYIPDPYSPKQTKVSPSSILSETLSRPTVCPVLSKTSSFVAPSFTICKTDLGLFPKILYTLFISILDIFYIPL